VPSEPKSIGVGGKHSFASPALPSSEIMPGGAAPDSKIFAAPFAIGCLSLREWCNHTVRLVGL
jgi:hypothetical protein